jgi:hypothetical protein
VGCIESNPTAQKAVGFFNSRNPEMPTITIDEKEYDYDLLSQDAKNQLASLQFVDNEIQRLEAQMAVLQTARNAYSKALNDALAVGHTSH